MIFDYTYFRLIYELLNEYLPAISDDVQQILNNAQNILLSIIFFGFLFTAYNFISKRWLTLNG